MMKKVLAVAGKIILGIFLFYLIVGFIMIPLVLTWAIPSQGTKILKTPVKLRSVLFNPFMLDLKINGLEILDANKKVMIGFDQMKADVSFINLLKKVYRVESFELDGLKVNAELLPNGHINLLDLVPTDTANQPAKTDAGAVEAVPVKKDAAVKTAQSVDSTGKPSEALPEAYIDSIVLKNGMIRFTDLSVTPHFSTALSQMNIKITNISTKADCQLNFHLDARLDEKGAVTIEAMMAPFAKPMGMETNFTLNDYAMTVLTPYVGKYTGHALKEGKLDVTMVYRIDHNKLTASHKVLMQRFEFGQKVESKDALNLPFGLAVGLLEDPKGRINITLPVDGDMSDPKFHYFHLLGQVARDFFLKLITKPFAFLGSVLGADGSGTDEVGTTHFLPGKTELVDAEKTKLNTLIKGLKERPKLRLEIDGGYDANTDWKAIKTEVFSNDYKKLRADSLKEDAWIYERLYERRFGIRKLWNLAKKYRAKDGTEDTAALNTEIKRQIVEDAPADKVAMAVLAEGRAKNIYDFMIAAGFDQARLSIGQPQEVQGSMGQIPLDFKLTVFENTAK